MIVAQPAALPVNISFLLEAPGSGLYGSKELFGLRIDVMVAIFLGLAAVEGDAAHGRIAGHKPDASYVGGRVRYEVFTPRSDCGPRNPTDT